MSSLSQSESPSGNCKKLSALRVVELKQELDKRGLEKTGVKAALIDRLRKCLEEDGLDPDTFAVELSAVKKSPARSRTNKEKEEEEEEEEEDLELEPEEMSTEEREQNLVVVEDVVGDVDEEDDQLVEDIDDDVAAMIVNVLDEDLDGGAEDEAEIDAITDEITDEIEDEEGVQMVGEEIDMTGEVEDMAPASECEPSEDTDVIDQLEESAEQEVIDQMEVAGDDGSVEKTAVVRPKTAEANGTVTAENTKKTPTPKTAATKTPPAASTKSPAATKVSTPATKVAKSASVTPKTTAAKVASPAVKVSTPKAATPATKKAATKATTPATKAATTVKTPVSAKATPPASKSATAIAKTTPSTATTKAVAAKTPVKTTVPAKAVTKMKAPLKASTPIAKGTKTIAKPVVSAVKPGTKTVVRAAAAATPVAAPVAATVTPSADTGTVKNIVSNGGGDSEEITDDLLIVHADELMDVDSDIVKPQPDVDTDELQKAGNDDDGGADGAEQQEEEEDTADAEMTEDNEATTAASGADAATDEKKGSKEAVVSSKVKSTPAKDGKPAAKSTSATSNQGSRNLWVSGLSSTTRATDLKNIFSKYGKVAGAKVVTNVRSPCSRCYGFVTMSTPDEASKCIQNLNRTELHGRMIGVERAKSDAGGQSKMTSAKKLEQAKKLVAANKKSAATKQARGHHHHHHRRTFEKKSHKSPVVALTASSVRPTSSGGRVGRVAANKSSGSTPGSRSNRPAGAQKSPRRHSNNVDVLSFDQIKAERERQRLRGLETWLRSEEKRSAQTLNSARARQRSVDRFQREETRRLAKEREQIKNERLRLAREKAETEKEQQKLARAKRDQVRLNKSVDHGRTDRTKMDKLRADDSRRAAKRPLERPASSSQRDVRWAGDSVKRSAVDSYTSGGGGYAQSAAQQVRSYSTGAFSDTRSGYDRRYDQTASGGTQAATAMTSRYADRPSSASRRDHDDRNKYSRYDERGAHSGSSLRTHHVTPASGHRTSTRGMSPPPAPSQQRRHVSSSSVQQAHRDRHQDASINKGGYSDSRPVTSSRDSGWHNLALQEERTKSRYNSTQDWGTSSSGLAVGSGTGGGLPSSMRSERWPMSQPTSAGGSMGSTGIAMIGASQPMGGTSYMSSGGVMMGSGSMGGGRPDMRYDAYKALSAGTALRRY